MIKLINEFMKKKYVAYLQKVQESQSAARKAPQDPDDELRKKQLIKDVLKLLRTAKNRVEFIGDLKIVLARYGQQVGSEQYKRALIAFDEYRRKPSRD
jgi:hypothetical protein